MCVCVCVCVSLPLNTFSWRETNTALTSRLGDRSLRLFKNQQPFPRSRVKKTRRSVRQWHWTLGGWTDADTFIHPGLISSAAGCSFLCDSSGRNRVIPVIKYDLWSAEAPDARAVEPERKKSADVACSGTRSVPEWEVKPTGGGRKKHLAVRSRRMELFTPFGATLYRTSRMSDVFVSTENNVKNICLLWSNLKENIW